MPRFHRGGGGEFNLQASLGTEVILFKLIVTRDVVSRSNKRFTAERRRSGLGEERVPVASPRLLSRPDPWSPGHPFTILLYELALRSRR